TTTIRGTSARTWTPCGPPWPPCRPTGVPPPGWCSPRTPSRCRWRPRPGRTAGGTRRSYARGPRWSPGPPPRTCRGTLGGRAGPAEVRWREPDVGDHLSALAAAGTTGVVVSPIGFISDHLEVVWDLDTEAAETAKQLGLDFARAATPGTDPRFVAMIRELVQE